MFLSLMSSEISKLELAWQYMYPSKHFAEKAVSLGPAIWLRGKGACCSSKTSIPTKTQNNNETHLALLQFIGESDYRVVVFCWENLTVSHLLSLRNWKHVSSLTWTAWSIPGSFPSLSKRPYRIIYFAFVFSFYRSLRHGSQNLILNFIHHNSTPPQCMQ